MMMIMLAMIFSGCGEDFGGDEDYTSPQNIDSGLSIEQSGDGVLLFEYLDNGAIKIICQGDCGDISINTTEDIIDEVADDCEIGFVWCPIEEKCILDE